MEQWRARHNQKMQAAGEGVGVADMADLPLMTEAVGEVIKLRLIEWWQKSISRYRSKQRATSAQRREDGKRRHRFVSRILEEDASAEERKVNVDLDAVSERYPDAISGGEQQRTAIARAVAHRPSLVIADEPTGNLDADTAAAVMRLIEHAVRSTGAALLMATHSRTMARHADRALHLERGRLRPADE